VLADLTPRILAASLLDMGFSNPFSPPLVSVDCKVLKNPGAAAPAGLEALLKIIRTAIAPAATPAAIKAAEAWNKNYRYQTNVNVQPRNQRSGHNPSMLIAAKDAPSTREQMSFKSVEK
jgi:hypothetical protein